ncbi:MAG: endonuclease/exonuclease/phosphatase family protein [Bacteriovoracaceae bacterium]
MRTILTIIFILTLAFNNNASASLFAKNFIHVPIENAHDILGRSFAQNLNPNSIKVFCWNIKKAEMPAWQNEFKKYGNASDLILIQEAYRNQLFNQTIQSFEDMRWDMAVSFLYRKDHNTASGTMIGSKVEPTEVLVKQTVDFEPVVHTPKTMTIAKYPIEGLNSELLVISIHGINITRFETFKRHLDQAKVEILKHDGPILFAGDFNSRTKQRIHYMIGLTTELKLKPIEFKNGNQRMAWKFTNNYLDWGFTRGLKVKQAEVITSSIGSDHKPLRFELQVD